MGRGTIRRMVAGQQRRAIAPPSALRAAPSPWLRHREDRLLATRRLTRAVDVEFLARALGIRVRHEPQPRSRNLGWRRGAPEQEHGVERVRPDLARSSLRPVLYTCARGSR